MFNPIKSPIHCARAILVQRSARTMSTLRKADTASAAKPMTHRAAWVGHAGANSDMAAMPVAHETRPMPTSDRVVLRSKPFWIFRTKKAGRDAACGAAFDS